jgi:hypothetical protein
MRFRRVVFALTLLFVGAGVCHAQNPNMMGTWKLNEAKSRFSPGANKNHTVVYEAAGDMIKVTVDGVDGSGGATHNEWTGKFDGKDYAVTGSPTSDMRSYTGGNARTLSLREKKGGKVVLTGTVTVSKDGRTRTVTTNGTDANGKRFRNVAVYDKQ